MGTVSDLFLNVQTFLNMQSAGNAQYVSLAVATTKILGWMTAITKYGQGIYLDSQPGVTDNSNPYIALANLNRHTLSHNSTGVNTSCANDLWVFDSTNCSLSAS